MAELWVKYRNKKSGAVGVCKYDDYKSAIKSTTKLTIIERYEGRPIGDGSAQKIENIEAVKKPAAKKKIASVKEPEAAKQAKKNADEKSKSNNSKE